jgi:hypothetical protein
MHTPEWADINDSLYPTVGTEMPTGPNGQKRPADVIGAAVMIAKIATGETKDTIKLASNKTKSGLAGAAARARNLTPEQRTEIAKKAASLRWE